MLSTYTADGWRRADIQLCAKFIAELSLEGVIPVSLTDEQPAFSGPGVSRYQAAIGEARYAFDGRPTACGGWTIRNESVVRIDDAGNAQPPTSHQLCIDLRPALSVDGARFADILAELNNTLIAEAQRLSNPPTVSAVVDMDYDTADGYLPGHPRIVINKGRVGFGDKARAEYSPETHRPFQLRWIAVSSQFARFSHTSGMNQEQFLRGEIGDGAWELMIPRLPAGTDAGDYVFVPVHPWQWDSVITGWYAHHLAVGEVVDLGEIGDCYLPHQTVRTLANVSSPGRSDLKTACSVRNTLVYRGLDMDTTETAPELTRWILSVDEADDKLGTTYPLGLIGEIASVSVRHPTLAAIDDLPYRFYETLGALWRPNVRNFITSSEHAVSMALLPLIDDGHSAVAEIISRSGVDPRKWFERLWTIILEPLLYWYYAYGVAFCPHSQNLILVLDDTWSPKRMLIKDFAQGVDLVEAANGGKFAAHEKLREPVASHVLKWPPHLMVQAFFSSIFAGQVRFLAEIAYDELGIPPHEMWEMVRRIVNRFHETKPEIVANIGHAYFYEETVERVCLNREHLSGVAFERVERDEEFDVREGRLINPVASPDPEGLW
ncbi:IucA/IucC family protein [Corynebacterium sp. TAE3-ERU16]|uniref:IucA/IucC family protein n=1 Tax=Corynebacterium sp. TAE3-ERU16 TaxID=2849493 RepID=UPI001C46A258|nr:IucA/IucC family protein [Corynebacterium sp. TAE3-ERU16]MBV7292918.1 hypothetical protein [Corynebacterium sp. TAE3-ERU16]